MINIIYVISGVLMILLPGHISDIICYIFAALVLSFAAYQVVKYTKNKKNLTLVLAILAGMFGIYIIFNTKQFASIIPTVAGVLILVDSITKVFNILELKKTGFKDYQKLLIPSVILLGLGLFLVFNPFGAIELIIILIGVVLITNGVFGIISDNKTSTIIEAKVIKKKK